MREGVPVKCRSTSAGSSPTASKIWAPQYDGIVEMPIFEIVFKSPLEMPLIARVCASSALSSPSAPSLASCDSDSSIRYGLTAAAP